MNLELLWRPENWHGSYYELAVEVGPTSNDDHLREVIRRIWSAPGLRGPWRSRDSFSLPPDASPGNELERILYGVAAIGTHTPIGLVVHVVREPEGSDWVDVCFPTAMLSHVFRVEYPIYSHPNPWRAEVDRFLANIALSLHSPLPFALALIGEEVSGVALAATLEPADCAHHLVLLPAAPVNERLSDVPRRDIAPGLTALGPRGSIL